MISIDQVLLLEEKVESAVKKIEQLNAENAALRSKCAELTNALNAKSEQFSSFESNQSKIEEGILKALSRLNAVENVVLRSASASVQSPSNPAEQSQQVTPPISQVSVEPAFEAVAEVDNSESAPIDGAIASDVDFEFRKKKKKTTSLSVNSMSPLENQNDSAQPEPEVEADSSQPMFDIF